MYLKSIEIQGFKSFANKIVLQFHNGITGIVGPNGSGKSNIADAVRWVLGEQRIKQLRGGTMQDVIFSGTELRKPLSYAYVAITLDNSDHQLAVDYEEVTVARRIYRSGESEYLINGTVCRLRDVNELFYDTGIGKEGYSIIGQGQIDKILSGKPEERRELFDEAAGIVKFKRRKAGAIAKLENEKQNLVRVTDILGELEKQTGPLERQAETAKIYLKKKENLKVLDINVFLIESEKIREQLSELEEKLKISNDELTDTVEQYEGIRVEYDQVQSLLEELEQLIEQERTKLADAGLLRGKLENQIDILKEQIHSAQGSRKHLESRMEGLQAEIESRKGESAAIQKEKEETDAALQDISLETAKVKEKLADIQEKIAQLNNQIETGKNTIMEELNKRAAIKSKMGRFDTMMEQINIRKSELNSKILRAKSDEEAREKNMQELEQKQNEVNGELLRLDESVAQKESALGDFREELTKKDEALRNLQSLYHQEKSKYEALSNLTERYEGYGGSVKKVMEQKDTYKGIIGVVADIIKVEPKYETAIETALGGNIQNVVTKDEDTAKKVIQYLKQNKLGRATFLPLTSIKNPQEFKNPDSLMEPGAIGMADTLVTIKDEYRDVAKAMLGRILVVDNVDNAVKIARKYEYGIRMVTLEGELLVPGGAISGGAFKNNSNLLGRRRELEELEKNTKKLLSQIDEKNREIDTVKANRNKLRLEIENLKGKIQQKTIELNTLKVSISQAKERMEEETYGVQSLRMEEKEIEARILEVRESKESVNDELVQSEQLEKTTQEKIKQYQSDLEQLRLCETTTLATYNEWELKVETMRQTQGFKQNNLDRINSEVERYQGELSEVEAALSMNATDVDEKRKSIESIQQQIQISNETKAEGEVKLQEALQKKENLTAKQKKFFNTREELAEKKSLLEKQVYQLNANKEKLEGGIEFKINYMWEEYELTLSDAASLRNPELTNLSEMKRDIADIKDQIKKLGNVNVNAIEEYRDLMERYTSMKTQYDDLVEAEKLLENFIEELDTSMRKQFTEKFRDINREFDKVFKELFGGGKGTLELMEDEDILEAGVRIIAQPPGKKLQNMMQLSGGEKALTAIALLFAIQNLKPSPFALLDEIEAALDDSNVGRFAKYLHKLTKNTQFIVITHRRGTMEQVDRLYGITMQEKGVSTLVSVNLIDKDLTD